MMQEQYTEINLEPLRFELMNKMPFDFVRCLRMSTDYDKFSDHARSLSLRIQGEIMTDKVIKEHKVSVSASVSVPANLKEYLKERFLPQFILDRFPVVYKTITQTETKSFTFDRRFLFPDLPVSNRFEKYIIHDKIHE